MPSGLSPDCLAFVARALDEVNNVEHRKTLSSLQARLIQRHASVLDSLAYISVSQTKQVVAVGAKLVNGDGHVVVLVAENGSPVPGLLEHLRDILNRLKRINAERPPMHRVEGYLSKAESTFEREIADLEVAILKYSWPQLRHRVKKRHENFIETAHDICGSPAQERTDLDDYEQDLLARLQASPALDHDTLRTIAHDIKTLAAVLELDASDELAKSIRTNLAGSLILYRRFHTSIETFELWNKYSRSRLEHKNAVVKKQPDVLRWLGKIVATRGHFLRIADIATSWTFPQLLLQNAQVQGVQPPSPRPISLDTHSMNQILEDAGCEVEQGSDSDNAVRQFMEMLETTHHESMTDGKLELTSPTPHCECQLLANLHNHPSIPYIGLSKLPCSFCDLFFTAYRDATNTEMYTRATHNQTVAWAHPTLVEDLACDADIREAVTLKLLARIRKGWDEYRRSLPDSADSPSGTHRYTRPVQTRALGSGDGLVARKRVTVNRSVI
ncbi:hypothetical protein DFH06DRAFT_668571 [Mycena polygramma]|nr:hypothetical protein DFH06DRAFT_668571 [Mycena polygramma]